MKLSKLESGVRVVLAFYEALNRRDITAISQLISHDCVFESAEPAPDGTLYAGKEAVIRFWEDRLLESPHLHIKIEEIFGLGFRCIVRWRYDWLDSNGNPGHVRGVDLYQVKNSLICEQLSYVKGLHRLH